MSRVSLLLTVTFATVLSTAAPASAQFGARSNTLAIPVVSTGTAAAFTGTFTLRRFVATPDGVAAVGLLTGAATPTGGTPTSIVQTVIVPAHVQMLTSGAGDVGTQQIDPGACGIVHLDLGPLFLDLLGLQVDLSQVILDIAAAPGAGNLLGNLLCAVTGLLDGPGGGLAALLNQILGILA
jgi:hypothetical protein